MANRSKFFRVILFISLPIIFCLLLLHLCYLGFSRPWALKTMVLIIFSTTFHLAFVLFLGGLIWSLVREINRLRKSCTIF